MIKKLISLFLIVVFLIPNIVIADNALIKEELVNSLPREELINVAIERGAKKEELESMSIFSLKN